MWPGGKFQNLFVTDHERVAERASRHTSDKTLYRTRTPSDFSHARRPFIHKPGWPANLFDWIYKGHT